MPLSAVIFDLDGVLADTESIQLLAVNTLLSPYGAFISKHEWGTVYVGTPIEEDLRRIRARFKLDISVETIADHRRAIYRDLLNGGTELLPTPGLLPLLDELEARCIPFGVASGSPREDVEIVLKALGVGERFHSLSTFSDVSRPKPAPDVYLLAMDKLGVTAQECVAIEDSASGMAAAHAAGLRVIAMPSEYTQHQNMSPAEARVSDLNQARELLFGPNSPFGRN